jgi:hypothetical protein
MAGRTWNRPRQQLLEYKHEDYKDPANTYSSYDLKTVAQRYGSSEWTRTPNWKQVQKAGNLPMNPYLWRQATSVIGGRTSYHVLQLWPDGSVYADYEDSCSGPGEIGLFPSNVDPLESDLADARSRNKVLNEVKNSKVNLGQVYAERHQTVLLAQKTVERVVRTVNYLRKGNWNAAANEVGMKPSVAKHKAHSKRHLKNPEQATAQGWLELQYGWRPLLQDLYGSLEFVQDKWARKVQQRVTKSGSDEDRPDRPSFTDGASTWTYEQIRKTKVKYTLYYSVPEEFLKTLSEAGITNPALIAWELTPWSFVVDWFLPVGSFISSWDATVGLTFEKGVKTTVQEVWDNTTAVGSVVHMYSGQHTYTKVNTTWRKYHSVQIQRVPIGGFPSVALPRFKNPLGWEHMANLSALLLSAFRR